MEGVVRRLADFLEVDLTDDHLARVLERSSFAFMKEHANKFDYLTLLGLEQNFIEKSFIREGEVGRGAASMDGKLLERYQDRFQAELGGTGLSFG